MPIYEFRCRDCGGHQEVWAKGPDEPLTERCGGCGSSDLERLLSAPSFLRRTGDRRPGHTCCGREERCEAPPCPPHGPCRRDGLGSV
jgi:putative FmdB family regulatory protein